MENVLAASLHSNLHKLQASSLLLLIFTLQNAPI